MERMRIHERRYEALTALRQLPVQDLYEVLRQFAAERSYAISRDAERELSQITSQLESMGVRNPARSSASTYARNETYSRYDTTGSFSRTNYRFASGSSTQFNAGERGFGFRQPNGMQFAPQRPDAVRFGFRPSNATRFDCQQRHERRFPGPQQRTTNPRMENSGISSEIGTSGTNATEEASIMSIEFRQNGILVQDTNFQQTVSNFPSFRNILRSKKAHRVLSINNGNEQMDYNISDFVWENFLRECDQLTIIGKVSNIFVDQILNILPTLQLFLDDNIFNNSRQENAESTQDGPSTSNARSTGEENSFNNPLLVHPALQQDGPSTSNARHTVEENFFNSPFQVNVESQQGPSTSNARYTGGADGFYTDDDDEDL